MNTDHFRKLENMYLGCNLNQQTYSGTKVHFSEGQAEIIWEIEPKFYHALGAMHGSVYFKLLDDSAFFAVNSLVEDVFVLTTNFNINLVRPAVSGKLKAIGKVKFKSKNLYIAESVIHNEQGKEIGFGTGHFMRSKVPLTEDIGYKL